MYVPDAPGDLTYLLELGDDILQFLDTFILHLDCAQRTGAVLLEFHTSASYFCSLYVGSKNRPMDDARRAVCVKGSGNGSG